MTSNTMNTPPAYDEEKYSWREYKKELEVWVELTSLPKRKQGPALFITLKGKAKEAISDMEIAELTDEVGFANMIAKLDNLFKKDENQEAYLAYKDFENFRRSQDMKIKDFIIKFESMYSRIKKHAMTLPEGVLAYRLLHSVNLRDEEMRLCRATIEKFEYEDMKKQIMRICGDEVIKGNDPVIKEEPVFYGRHDGQYDGGGKYRGSNANQRGYSFRGGRGGFRGGNVNQTRGRGYSIPQKSTNPIGKDGKPSRCLTCGSKYHWSRNCPDNGFYKKKTDEAVGFCRNNYEEDEDESEEIEISLLQTTKETACLRQFLGETIGCAIVDSGCSKTVAGKQWMDCYMESLEEGDLKKVTSADSKQSFKFGEGHAIPSMGKFRVPAKIGSTKVTIETDVVNADIPMLLSKESLKRAGTVLDFNNDSAIMFEEKQRLIATKSGHYAVPLTITTNENLSQEQIILIAKANTQIEASDPRKIAEKLHRQFCHCSAERLNRLIKSSSLFEHDREREIMNAVNKVTSNCNTCKVYKRAPAVPIVSLSLAHEFNDTVAMDLIVITHGTYIVHLIDMFTRYSVACVRKSKKQDVIADGIMKIWISYFGKPKRFLADNGGEFANSEYNDMCEAFDIEMLKTSAESPWSNGLCERHNGVIKESVMKIIDDTKCTLETAVAWAVSSKNTLYGHGGYSPNTLVFGRNPNFPSVISDRLPAITAKNLSSTVEMNLKAMRAAREGFIEAESSEKLKRALAHNVRSSMESHFQNGEKVFFKRKDEKRWHGPGVVVGQDGKQILLKNGGELIRVHVTRVIHVDDRQVENSDVEKIELCPVDSSKENELGKQSTQPLLHIEDENPDMMGEVMEDIPVHDMNSSLSSGSERIQADPMINQVFPKVKTNIMYRLNQSNEWRKGFVHSRAGKIGGTREFCFNIQDPDTEEINWHDFKNNVNEWQPMPAEVLITSSDKESIHTAKLKEFENWQNNHVFEEVDDNGQHVISTRWVITTKEKHGCMITKARLVVRGFEDHEMRKENTDSPTCSKETIRISISLMAAKEWDCESLDIKTAFLQGNPLERDIFVKPPKEANTNKIWKLKKAVYGLNEASRHWYDRVHAELSNIGMTRSKYDEALFFWKKDNQLKGLIVVHVDDFLYGGTVEFHEEIMSKIASIFEIGTMNSTPMKYLGMNVYQDKVKIVIDQNDYIANTDEIVLNSSKDKDRVLTNDEQHNYRAICGQLNWIASQSRPDVSFDVCQLSTKLNKATVRDLLCANKAMKKIKANDIKLRFNRMSSPLHLVAYCDASYANLPNGASQGGMILFLADDKGNHSPISWSSRKLRRVCRSTITAETMSMLDTIDASIWISHIINEINDSELGTTIVRTDNMSLTEAVHSTTAVEEKRLRVEIASIRESIRDGLVEVHWLRKEDQLADTLTKQGADASKLLDVLCKSNC